MKKENQEAVCRLENTIFSSNGSKSKIGINHKRKIPNKIMVGGAGIEPATSTV